MRLRRQMPLRPWRRRAPQLGCALGGSVRSYGASDHLASVVQKCSLHCISQ
jgi:hypothetical protein